MDLAPVDTTRASIPVAPDLVYEFRPRAGGDLGPARADKGASTAVNRAMLMEQDEERTVLRLAGNVCIDLATSAANCGITDDRPYVATFRASGAFTRSGASQHAYVVHMNDYQAHPPTGTRRIIVIEGERIVADVPSGEYGGIETVVADVDGDGLDELLMVGKMDSTDVSYTYSAAIVGVKGGTLHVRALGVVAEDGCSKSSARLRGSRVSVVRGASPKITVEPIDMACAMTLNAGH